MKKYQVYLLTLTFLILLVIIGCDTSSSKDFSSIQITTSSITGKVSQSLNSLSQPQVLSTSFINAKVWLEEIPDINTFTKSDGSYTLKNVPHGSYNIVAKSQSADSIYKARVQSVEVSGNKPLELDINTYEAKNYVTGFLKSEEGDFLPPGTPMALWGEEFYVEKNGFFRTPTLPDLETDFLVNDIIINPGKSNQAIIKAAFVYSENPTEIHTTLPASPKQIAQMPSISIVAIADQKPVAEVEAGNKLTLKAYLYPPDIRPENIKWEASGGTFDTTTAVLSNAREKQWIAPQNGGEYQITLSSSYLNYSYKATIKIKVNSPPLYRVFYLPGLGTIGDPPSDENYYIANSQVVVKDIAPVYKEGYNFVGWNTAQDGSGLSFLPGSEFTIFTEDIYLVAQWQRKQIFSVAYDGNGNTSGYPPLDHRLYFEGSQVTVASNSRQLQKSGYIFEGWTQKKPNEEVIYLPEDIIDSLSDNITFYALWTPVYRIIYDGNNQTTGSSPVDTKEYKQGEEAKVLDNITLMTKHGFNFAGWNTRKDGSGSIYLPDEQIHVFSDSITLYARWLVVSTFNVSYRGNYNTDGLPPADYTSYEEGTLVTVLTNSGSLVRTGYKFWGWNTKADASGIDYLENDQFEMPSSNLVLYARWLPTYRVYYHAIGNYTGAPPEDNSYYDPNTQVTILGNTNNLARDKYIFGGWNTSADSTGTNYSPGTTINMPFNNLNLYSKWTPVYTITYHGNGNTDGTVPIDPNQYQLGYKVTIMGNSGNLAKTSHTFTLWNTLQDGTGTDYAPNSVFYIGTGDMDLYAQWEKDTTYKIAYNPNGAQGSVPRDDNEYFRDDRAIIKGISDDLTKSGYQFSHWNTNHDDSGISYTKGEHLIIEQSNVTLYAIWVPIPTYTVTYDPNAQLYSGDVPQDHDSYNAGTEVTVLGFATLSRTGYTIKAWNTSADGYGIDYYPTQKFRIGSSNVTLYARWILDPTDISLESVLPSHNSTSVSINCLIVLNFSEDVDKESVESAVSFSPDISGSWQWLDDRSVSFSPDQPLRKGTFQTVNIAPNTVKSKDNYKTLVSGQQICFEVESDLPVPSGYKSAGFSIAANQGDVDISLPGLPYGKQMWAAVIAETMPSSIDVSASIDETLDIDTLVKRYKNTPSALFRVLEQRLDSVSFGVVNSERNILPERSVNVGDTQEFNIYPAYSLYESNTCIAECKLVTETAYVFVDTYFNNPDPTLINYIGSEWDNAIYPILTDQFGDDCPAGPDGDPRTTILLLNLTGAGGYFYGLDLSTPKDSSSNGRKIIYAQYSTGNHLIGTIAHEYQHLINYYNKRLKDGSPQTSEQSWINEGLSEYAPQLCNYGIEIGDTVFLARIKEAQEKLDLISLPRWDAERYNYGLSHLFIRFLAQPGRYAATSREVTRHLVNSQYVGIANIEAITHEPFKITLANFFISTFINRHDSILPNDYGLKGLDLKGTYNNLSLVGMPYTQVSDNVANFSIQAWGVKFLKKISTGEEINFKIKGITQPVSIWLWDER